MQDADNSITNLAQSTAVGGVSVALLSAVLEAQGITLDRELPARMLARLSHCVEFGLGSDAGELRLRVPLRSSAALSASELERERLVLATLNKAVEAMPQPLVFHAGDAADLLPFVVFADAAGTPAIELPGLSSAATCTALVNDLARVMGDLHAFDPQVMQEAGLAPRRGFVHGVLQGWRVRANLVTEHTPPGALMELVDWVEDMAVTDPDELAPVHNALSLQRVLVVPGKGKHGPKVSALLDWSACTLGDPLIDLGALLVGWSEAGDPAELLALDYVMSSPPAMGRQAFATAYAEAMGLSLDDLPFYRVIGLMRAAVYELKRFARVRRGLEQRIEGLDHAEVSECLLDLAMDVSMGRAF